MMLSCHAKNEAQAGETTESNGLDWEVLENGTVVARFNAQLRASAYAEMESYRYPGHFYLVRHVSNPEGEKSAIVHNSHTYVRHG